MASVIIVAFNKAVEEGLAKQTAADCHEPDCSERRRWRI